MHYRPEIDGLRAVAVCSVILFHAGFKGFSGGFVGVDVFFVISGYLITRLITLELDEGKFSIVTFYERRARRILPALFVILTVSVVFAWIWLLPWDMKEFSQSLVAVSVFASNIFFWKISGYFDTVAESKPLLHTWSLAVEEQYYVLFPVMLMAVSRVGKHRTFTLFALMAVISLVAAEMLVMDEPATTFYLLPTRGWELLLGALVALRFDANSPRQRNGLLCEVGGVMGCLLIGYSVVSYNKDTPFPSLYTLVPTAGTALIIFCASQNTFVGKVLSSKPLVGIGLISYSAYLWHQPLLSFERHRTFEEPNYLIKLALILMTFLLAYVTWLYVEVPFRQKQRFSRRQVFVCGLAGSSVFAMIGMAGHVTGGFEKLRTTEAQASVLKTAVSSPKREECHTGGSHYRKVGDACEYHHGALSWAIFGDSHTVELAYALAEELKKSGQKLKHFSFSGCAPMFGRQDGGRLKDCAKWTAEAVEYIASKSEIKNVVVTYRIHAALFGDHENRYPSLPADVDESERARRWKSYVDVLRYFLNNDKNVILVLQSPELPKPIDALLFRTSHPLGEVPGVKRVWWDKRIQYVMLRLNELPSRIHIVDPTRLFCNEVHCMAANHGIAFYFDDDHMSLSGAAMVAKEVVQYATH